VNDPFRDRVAVVTGGAQGIGLAMARAFAGRGAKLVLADRDESALSQAQKELSEDGASVIGVPTDVTQRADVDALAAATVERFGAVHIVCNNAGIAVMGSLVGADPADWEAAMAVNFWGVVYGVDAFVPRMLAQGQGGDLINTASMAGLVGMQQLGVYCVTKFAVVALSESLERELKPQGLGVHVLCPMIVATNIGRNSARVLGRPEPAVPEPRATLGNDDPQARTPWRGETVQPDEVAQRVVRGVERGSLYIFTHPEQREILRRRAGRQDAVFETEFEGGTE
jgi:NAD(P)-dependent dehydrogenase (short-subunit alcohol dehydrogenase family)